MLLRIFFSREIPKSENFFRKKNKNEKIFLVRNIITIWIQREFSLSLSLSARSKHGGRSVTFLRRIYTLCSRVCTYGKCAHVPHRVNIAFSHKQPINNPRILSSSSSSSSSVVQVSCSLFRVSVDKTKISRSKFCANCISIAFYFAKGSSWEN